MGLHEQFDDLSPRDHLVGHRRVYDLDGLHADLEAGRIKPEHDFLLREALSNGQMLDWGPELLEGFGPPVGCRAPSAAANIGVGPASPRTSPGQGRGDSSTPRTDHRSTPRSPDPGPRPGWRRPRSGSPPSPTTSRKLVAIGRTPTAGPGSRPRPCRRARGRRLHRPTRRRQHRRPPPTDREDCDHGRHDEGRRRGPHQVSAHVRGPRGGARGRRERRAAAAGHARSLSAGAAPATDPPPRRRSRTPSGSAMSRPSVPPAAAKPAAATWPVSRPASSSASTTTSHEGVAAPAPPARSRGGTAPRWASAPRRTLPPGSSCQGARAPRCSLVAPGSAATTSPRCARPSTSKKGPAGASPGSASVSHHHAPGPPTGSWWRRRSRAARADPGPAASATTASTVNSVRSNTRIRTSLWALPMDRRAAKSISVAPLPIAIHAARATNAGDRSVTAGRATRRNCPDQHTGGHPQHQGPPQVGPQTGRFHGRVTNDGSRGPEIGRSPPITTTSARPLERTPRSAVVSVRAA